MQEILNRLNDIPTSRDTLTRADFEASPYSGGDEETAILEYQARQPLAVRDGARYRIVPVVRETFSTDGTADNSETFNLGSNLIDSDVSEDVVLYDAGSRAQPDSVDYTADSFDYSSPNTDSTLTVYYVAATQATLKLKKVGPGGSNSETLVQHDIGIINRRDPNRDPLEFNLNLSPLQGTVPTDWSLEWRISGPFNSGWDPENDPTPVNFLVSLPINRANVSEVEGLASEVSRDTSERV